MEYKRLERTSSRRLARYTNIRNPRSCSISRFSCAGEASIFSLFVSARSTSSLMSSGVTRRSSKEFIRDFWLFASSNLQVNQFPTKLRASLKSRISRKDRRSASLTDHSSSHQLVAQVTKLPGDLSVEKGLIGVTVEESQNCSTNLSEQNICHHASCCSHYERNCTHSESECKANLRLRLWEVAETRGINLRR